MDIKTLALRALRWLVWAALCLIFIRGVAVTVVPPATAPLAAPAPAPPPEPEGLRSFPALFATEYLTWRPGQSEDRAARLAPYLARHLDRQAGWSPGEATAAQEVTGAWVHRIQPVGPDRWLVTVAVRTVVIPTGGPPTARTLFLTVPVAHATGGWVVYDYPALVPPPAPASVPEPVLEGQEIPDEGGQVRALLTAFLRAYVQGDATAAAYYLAPGVNTSTLDGRFALEGVGNVTVIRAGQTTRALAEARLRDVDTGARLTGRYAFELAQRDGRWYIQAILQKGA